MTKRVPQASWRQRSAGLGILAARLLVAVQEELYMRLDEAGYSDLTYQHGVVFAHLDEEGTRATEIAKRSGRHKQAIGRIIDELEVLGYVVRQSEPADRRAKLIVPTHRGIEVMKLSDKIIRDIEDRLARAMGEARFEAFQTSLEAVVTELKHV